MTASASTLRSVREGAPFWEASPASSGAESAASLPASSNASFSDASFAFASILASVVASELALDPPSSFRLGFVELEQAIKLDTSTRADSPQSSFHIGENEKARYFVGDRVPPLPLFSGRPRLVQF